MTVSTTGEHALNAARHEAPAAAIVDVTLGSGMDGLDLVIAMKGDADLRAIPILVVTASDTVNGRGLAFGGADYLLKPVSPSWLLAVVQKHLSPLRGKRILIADDDDLLRRQMVETLALEDGLVIEEAANGTDALAALDRQIPDLLILDLLMPGVDGFEVLRSLRGDRRAANLEVLVVTGKELTPQEKAYIKARMASLVRKTDTTVDHVVHTTTQLIGTRVAKTEA